MIAIVVFLSTPIDAAKLAEYGPKALATVTSHGGTALGLGPLSGLSNGAAYTHGAIFSFADRAAATGWFESSDYQALTALRGEAMHCSIDIVG